MSDEECGGLPTAHNARVLECDNCSDLVLTSYKQTLDEMHNTECLRCEEGLLQIQRRELVRRSDVKKLIKDKIEELHQLNRAYQDEYRPIPYSVSENIDQIKEELLEEVEGEASE